MIGQVYLLLQEDGWIYICCTRLGTSSGLGNGPAGLDTAGSSACSAAGTPGGIAVAVAAAVVGRRPLVRTCSGRIPVRRRALQTGLLSRIRSHSRSRSEGQSSLASTALGCGDRNLYWRQPLLLRQDGGCGCGGRRFHVRSYDPSSVARLLSPVSGNSCSRHG